MRISFSQDEFAEIIHFYFRALKEILRDDQNVSLYNAVLILSNFEYFLDQQIWRGTITREMLHEEFFQHLEGSNQVKEQNATSDEVDVSQNAKEYIGIYLKLIPQELQLFEKIVILEDQVTVLFQSLESLTPCDLLMDFTDLLEKTPPSNRRMLAITGNIQSKEDLEKETQYKTQLSKNIRSKISAPWFIFRFYLLLKSYLEVIKNEPARMRAARFFSQKGPIFNATACNAAYLTSRLETLLSSPDLQQNTDQIFIEVLAASAVLEVARHCIKCDDRPADYCRFLTVEWLGLCKSNLIFLKKMVDFSNANKSHKENYALTPPESMVNDFLIMLELNPLLRDSLNNHFLEMLKKAGIVTKTNDWRSVLKPQSEFYRRVSHQTAYQRVINQIMTVNGQYLLYRSKKFSKLLFIGNKPILAAQLRSAEYLQACLKKRYENDLKNTANIKSEIAKVIVEVMGISMILEQCRPLIDTESRPGEICRDLVKIVLQLISDEFFQHPIAKSDEFIDYVKLFFTYCREQNQNHTRDHALSPPESMQENFEKLLDQLKQRENLTQHAHDLLNAAKTDPSLFPQRESPKKQAAAFS